MSTGAIAEQNSKHTFVTMDFNFYTFLKKICILLLITQRVCDSYILNNNEHLLNHHTHHRSHHGKSHHINTKSYAMNKSGNSLPVDMVGSPRMVNTKAAGQSASSDFALQDGDNNPCLTHYCPKGRECELDAATNVPTCICQRSCDRRNNSNSAIDAINDKPICGSDGMVYENHCELHRAACILNRPIAFQRLEKCTTNIEIPVKKSINKSRVHERKPESDMNDQQSNVSIDGKDESNYNRNNNNNDNNDNANSIEQNLAQSESGENERLANKCTSQEYEIMKDNLLLFNHARLMTRDNNHSKDFLVSIMFSHYDQNNNGHLDAEELNQVSQSEQLDELSNGCILRDMLRYDDLDNDQCLSINEFYQAFNKLYSEC